MSTQTISFSKYIQTSSQEAYRAFTNATALLEWLCDVATVSPHPGGRLYLWWNSGYYTSGEYTYAEKGKKVAFTWHGRGEPAPTQVQVTFTPKENGTLITIDHVGLGTGEGWSRVFAEAEKGWKNGLENLASVMETGKDLRFVSRPMLGILLNDFTPKIAKQMGVPVSEGIRLSGTVEGMGAKAAGLQEDDVIVDMAGIPILDFDSLHNVVAKYHAGDEIEVEFYRGLEKMSVMMKLSGRSIPEIPFNPGELANVVNGHYKTIKSRLDEFIDSVTEEEASFKPSPSDWSIKGVLAHLIHSEQLYRSYIDELVGGNERFADEYGENLDVLIEATIAVYPTLKELVQEYKRNLDETIYILANLPEEFVARKGSYWRLAYGLVEEPYHFFSHVEQMQAALEAARKK
jgi:uncharacterized protein YndB with AHSA1/START domain